MPPKMPKLSRVNRVCPSDSDLNGKPARNNMQLFGNTLGERQKYLNKLVNGAVANKVDFDEIIAQDETDDLDKLFKIDVASKYKNIDYIMEVLKCGDSLYVTRALKCTWLYDDAYSDCINPDYLQDKVFPLMSMKMKTKFLKRLSTYVISESRAESFFTYCTQEDLDNIALKFLIHTSEEFKLALIENDINQILSLKDNSRYLKYFMGNSLKLIENYLNQVSQMTSHFFYNLRFMYFVYDSDFMKMIEQSFCDANQDTNFKRLSLKISKDIMKNHKERVFNNFHKYMQILNESIFLKFTSVEEAKQYLTDLLPSESKAFWSMDFCKTYKLIINLLPSEERFVFIQKIFHEKYMETPFEITKEFEDLNYCMMMNVDEREVWALRCLETRKYFWSPEDYNLYLHVGFEKAFLDLSERITRSDDYEPSTKRTVLTVLLKLTHNQRDLEKLINHLYNEQLRRPENKFFVDAVPNYHNVYDFDDDCWAAFDRLLHIIDVYNLKDKDNSINSKFGLMALIYHLIHKKDIPEQFKQYIELKRDFCLFKEELTKLGKEQQVIVYRYLMKFYENKIRECDNKVYDDNVKVRVRQYICFIKEMLEFFDNNEEFPDIVDKFIKLDQENFSPNEREIQEIGLIRDLKNDAALVVGALPTLEHEIIFKNKTFLPKQLLHKLKVYFSNDIAMEYIDFFSRLLSNQKLNRNIAFTAVHGITQLANDCTISEFLAKYVPLNSKIDLYSIDRNVYIQEAICRFACYSRLTVPLSKICPYIKGGYLKYCSSIIDFYTFNLPIPRFMEFVDIILEADESVQKRGLILVCNNQCFSVTDLNKYVQRSWQNTKNPSFRKFIFFNFREVFVNSDDNAQTEMFDVLKTMILDFNNGDDDELVEFTIDCKMIPLKFIGKYLEAVWIMLSQLDDNTNNKVTILNYMTKHYKLLDKDCVQNLMDTLVLKDKAILAEGPKRTAVCKLLVIYFTESNEVRWIVDSIKLIVQKFRELWNINDDAQKSCIKFIGTIAKTNFESKRLKRSYNNIILETMLAELKKYIPEDELYMILWDIQLCIIATKSIDKDKSSVGTYFGQELALLIKERVKSKKYYRSFHKYRVSAINTIIPLIMHATSIHPHDIHNFKFAVGMALIESGSVETYLIGTEMISITDCCYTCQNTYNDLVKKIKDFDNKEVQCLLYQKFFEKGFCKYMAKVMFE